MLQIGSVAAVVVAMFTILYFSIKPDIVCPPSERSIRMKAQLQQHPVRWIFALLGIILIAGGTWDAVVAHQLVGAGLAVGILGGLTLLGVILELEEEHTNPRKVKG